jgi:hypothetical protein
VAPMAAAILRLSIFLLGVEWWKEFDAR